MRALVQRVSRASVRVDDETVGAIALECGFHDHAHLSRSFRKLMHCSPSGYRG